jgi:plastocyanin
MKLVALLLVSITGVVLAGLIQPVDSELLPNGIYLLQGSGYIITEESIEDSALDFQISTGKQVGSRTSVVMHDGLVSTSNDDYVITDGWTATTIFGNRFLTLSGNAENVNGDEISLRLLGKLIEDSEDGSVYTFTGRIIKDDETMKLAYIAKVIGTNALQPTETQPTTKTKTIQINILAGSSDPSNINYYSMDTVEITPGTTIVWKNDDSMSHRIMSGIASFSPGKPFKPDGKIDSGEIAPGQTFSVTIDNLGITRFFDTTYYWMDGVIISLPEEKSTSLGTKESALDKTKKYQ